MSHLIPDILIGDRILTVSENFLIIPNNDLRIEVPTGPSIKPLVFLFKFTEDKSGEFSSSISAKGTTVVITLVNTLKQSFGVGPSDWHSLKFGHKHFSYLFSVQRVGQAGLDILFSLYTYKDIQ